MPCCAFVKLLRCARASEHNPLGCRARSGGSAQPGAEQRSGAVPSLGTRSYTGSPMGPANRASAHRFLAIGLALETHRAVPAACAPHPFPRAALPWGPGVEGARARAWGAGGAQGEATAWARASALCHAAAPAPLLASGRGRARLCCPSGSPRRGGCAPARAWRSSLSGAEKTLGMNGQERAGPCPPKGGHVGNCHPHRGEGAGACEGGSPLRGRHLRGPGGPRARAPAHSRRLRGGAVALRMNL